MIFDKDIFDKFAVESVDESSLDAWRTKFENSELEFSNLGYKISFLNSLGLKYSELIASQNLIDIFCRSDKKSYYPAYFFNLALFVYETECECCPEFEFGMIESILVNLGNEYANQYRILEALDCYQQAIDINPSSAMALFNRAICMHKMANASFYCDMLKYYNELVANLSAIDSDDLENGAETYQYLVEQYQKLGRALAECNPDLNAQLFSLTRCTRDNYSNWLLYNALYLNPINSLNIFNEARKDIIIDAYLPADSSRMLNEVFDYYKYLRKKLFLLRDKGSVTSMRECVEIFKSAYSIFDKIAYILAKAFKLNIKESAINYTTIWEAKYGLLEYKNVYLYDLYWLQQEYRPNRNLKANEVDINPLLAPRFREFVRLRNELEHRVEPISKYEFHYLYGKAKALLQVIRKALLNLNWVLHDEQNPALYNEKGERNKALYFMPEIEW